MSITDANQNENPVVSVTELNDFREPLVAFGINVDNLDSMERGSNLFGDHQELGHLSIGLPKGFSNRIPQVAHKLYWFPAHLPEGNSIFVGSSRLKQKLEEYESWFAALRTLGSRVNPSRQFLITAGNVSTDRFVKRIGELFRKPVCEFFRLPVSRPVDEIHQESKGKTVCYFAEAQFRNSRRPKQGELDQLLTAAATQVFLLSARGNGNTSAAVRKRLEHQLDTRILFEPKLTPKRKLDEFLQMGAVGWWLFDELQEPVEIPTAATTETPVVPILAMEDVEFDSYLIHWTRRRAEKWPDQSELEYLDDLIFGSTRANHDPLSTLSRILATDRILASHDLTRDSTPVVCLSEVPLNELSKITRFRPHLARWDGLPFGIAINKEFLTKQGAQAVVYGDDEVWNSLSRDQKPFFQKSQTRSGKIDWTLEKEWRLIGDLDLRKIDRQNAFVFVPTLKAAEHISRLSRWPIVVLNHDPHE